MEHDHWRDYQHRHGVLGDAVREHHGLRAGALQLFRRATFWHGTAGHDVEARYAAGRFLGTAHGHASFDWLVGVGTRRPFRPGQGRPFAARAGYGGKYVSRVVVMFGVRGHHGICELGDTTETRYRTERAGLWADSGSFREWHCSLSSPGVLGRTCWSCVRWLERNLLVGECVLKANIRSVISLASCLLFMACLFLPREFMRYT